MFQDIISNKVLWVCVITWVFAQLVKMLITLVREKRFDLALFVSSGGMPSAHSAVVSALATAIAMTQGFGSAVFAVAVILAFIVMYDSAGVRQSVGQQSTVLNRIVNELKLRQPLISMEADLRELVGHTPFQVIVGAVMGIVIAWLWLFLTGV